MPANIIIGIGGTGAKVVESVLHASAAGLGPDSLEVGFVDQDRSNGNVARARLTLGKISGARREWRAPGGPQQLGDSSLLRTSVRPLGPGLWVPHEQQQSTLAQILGDLRDDQPLFDLLFAKGESEQEMRLDEGYRGRAHIGAAAITAAMDENAEFWRSLLEQIRSAKGGDTVKIMLVGSAFGGTGAAGFPTIARLIRRFLSREGIDRNIMLGGALMLPYFRFSSPDDPSANVAVSEDLLPQTRGALRYYHSLVSRERVFDELYFVGWNPSFDLGYHRPGTGEQRNPALVPELIAALGVCRFFNPDHQPSDPIVVIARQDERAVGWADLPSPVPLNARLPYDKLGQQLRFAAAWKHWEPILARRGAAWKPTYERHSWYKAHDLHQIDFDQSPPTDAIRALSEYIDLLIEWAGSMEAYAVNQQFRWTLWEMTQLLSGPADFENPQQPVNKIHGLGEPQFGSAMFTAVPPLDASDPPPSAAELHRKLNEKPYVGGAEGMGKIVEALHDNSSVYSRGMGTTNGRI